MKLAVIADEDTFLQTLARERADVLISCGDIPDPFILQTAKLAQPARIFAVKGNHDSSAPFPAPVLDLHLRTESYNGLLFGGFCGSWKYKSRGHFLFEQAEVETLLAAFPPVDVFVSHNSPRHVHDREDDIHFGFEAFMPYIRRAQPRIFFHGHQHINQETRIGETRVIGVYGIRRFVIPGKGDVAASSGGDEEKQKIREVIDTWIRASAAGDLESVLPLMAEDVVFLLPGQPPMRGRAAYAAASRAMAGKIRFEGSPDIQEIQIAGNYAYCWNHLSVTITPLPQGSPRHLAGNILSIFRKEPDGRWLLYRDANLLAANASG